MHFMLSLGEEDFRDGTSYNWIIDKYFKKTQWLVRIA